MPKMSQEPPKRRPRCAKNRPRAAPEASWKRPIGALGRRHAAKHPQTPSRPRFCTIFGRILGSFWVDFWKDFQINWIHTLETIRWPCWPPPLLRGFHLEERTVAGTPLCGARDNKGNNTCQNVQKSMTGDTFFCYVFFCYVQKSFQTQRGRSGPG